MDLEQLQTRALEIVDHYAQLNQQANRPQWEVAEYMQAFVGDVGDLAKLIMAKNNFREITDHDSKIAHELSDCLWAILVIANKLNIDLEKSFQATMDTIETKTKQQLN